MNKKIGFISLLTASLIFGVYGVFVRELDPFVTPSQQIYFRYLIGVFFVLALIMFRKDPLKFKLYFNWKSILFGITIPASFLLFNLTLLNTKLSVGISGYYAGLLILSILMGKIVYREVLDKYSITGLILVTIGFYFLSNIGSFQPINMGFLYGIFGGGLYSLANFFKKNLTGLSKLDLLLLISFYNTVVLSVLSIVREEPLPVFHLTFILIMLVFLILALLAEYLTVVGFRNFNLFVGSIILSLEIFFSGIIGHFVYKEYLEINEIVGIIFIVLAVVVSNIKGLFSGDTKS